MLIQTSTAAAATLRPQVAFNSIVFATDFSPASEAALPFARAVARHYLAKLHLLHVLSPSNFLPVQPEPCLVAGFEQSTREFQRKAFVEAGRRMSQLYDRGQLAGILWDVVLREGDVAREIALAIHDLKADLVVLGTHGRSGLSKLLLGSVAEEVFRTAACPVLTAGPKLARDHSHRGIHIRNIICATDFSSSAARVVPFAAALARDHGAHITWLTVAPGSGDELPFRRRMAVEEARRRLDALLPGAGDADSDVRAEFGAASQRILSAATAHQADLIVMGVRGLGAIAAGSTHLPGGTTVKVICQAPCPVLTIRG